MDQPWQIELFGWLRVVQGDRIISRFRSRKAESLLAYLAYFRDRSHPRQQLSELLWPESDPAVGSRKLSVELTSLRRQLEPPGVPAGAVLVTTRTAVQLNPAACVTDVELFEAALQAARRAESPAERAGHLTAAVERYRGELLPGYFEDWVLPERQRLAEAFLGALHALVDLLEDLGDRTGATEWARRTVAADPLDEESHHRLIRLLLAAGQVEAARIQYEQGQERLLRELGSGLSPEIRALIRDTAPAKDRPPATPAGMRRQRRRRGTESPEAALPPAASASGPRSSSSMDEGGAPGDGALPSPIRQPSGAATRPCDNLPLRFTRFFGREPEIAALAELLGETADGGYPPQVGGQMVDGSVDSVSLPDYRLPPTAYRLPSHHPHRPWRQR